MPQLYPELTPNNTYQLEVGGGHTVYMEESGNPEGIPVLFLHGGPGGGSTEKHRRYFNPKKYRIVIFDQRGANRSTPSGLVEANSTEDLLNDMEAIREKLGIDKWMLFGGSWGATLALLYAQTYPDKILAMILRGSFLARKEDLFWFTELGANRLLPDYWADFLKVIDDDEDIINAYHERIHGSDKDKSLAAARSWSNWNARVVTYLIFDGELEQEPNEVTLHNAMIETHYAKNNYFLDDNQILNNIQNIPDVPVRIIHGRRDITCTADASWQLHQAIKNSELQLIPDGGHLASDKAICDALIQATDDYAGLIAG
jgi:proline iminopeptidase